MLSAWQPRLSRLSILVKVHLVHHLIKGPIFIGRWMVPLLRISQDDTEARLAASLRRDRHHVRNDTWAGPI